MDLARNLSKVEKFEVLDANNQAFDNIRLGVLVNKQFYFDSNSQWELLKEGGKFSTPEKLKDVSILKLKL